MRCPPYLQGNNGVRIGDVWKMSGETKGRIYLLALVPAERGSWMDIAACFGAVVLVGYLVNYQRGACEYSSSRSRGRGGSEMKRFRYYNSIVA